MKGRLLAVRRGVSRFDQAVDSGFDHLRGRPVADRVFYAASELGDFGLLWVLIGALRGLRSDRDFQSFLQLTAAMGVESVLVNGIVKSFFRRTRPPWEIDRPLHIRRPLTSSFPSGHATSAFSAAVILTDEDPHLWPLYFGLATIVATSRVYVKIHHASDVAAGMALGVLLGAIGRQVIPKPPPR